MLALRRVVKNSEICLRLPAQLSGVRWVVRETTRVLSAQQVKPVADNLTKS